MVRYTPLVFLMCYQGALKDRRLIRFVTAKIGEDKIDIIESVRVESEIFIFISLIELESYRASINSLNYKNVEPAIYRAKPELLSKTARDFVIELRKINESAFSDETVSDGCGSEYVCGTDGEDANNDHDVTEVEGDNSEVAMKTKPPHLGSKINAKNKKSESSSKRKDVKKSKSIPKPSNNAPGAEDQNKSAKPQSLSPDKGKERKSDSRKSKPKPVDDGKEQTKLPDIPPKTEVKNKKSKLQVQDLTPDKGRETKSSGKKTKSNSPTENDAKPTIISPEVKEDIEPDSPDQGDAAKSKNRKTKPDITPKPNITPKPDVTPNQDDSSTRNHEEKERETEGKTKTKDEDRLNKIPKLGLSSNLQKEEVMAKKKSNSNGSTLVPSTKDQESEKLKITGQSQLTTGSSRLDTIEKK